MLLRSQLEQLIDYGHTLGLEYMICSSSGGVHRDPTAKGELTLDDWRYVAEEFNRIGEKVKSRRHDLRRCTTTRPSSPTRTVCSFTTSCCGSPIPKLVVFEMDCGWVTAAGHNPVDYLKKTPRALSADAREGYGTRLPTASTIRSCLGTA